MTGAPDLQALLATWQKRLRLRDWTVDVQYVDGLNVPCKSSAFVDDMQAQIQIRTPRSAEDAAKVQKLLIQELLRVKCSPLFGANREPASLAQEDQLVGTFGALLSELGDSPEGQVLVRAMAREMRAPQRASGRNVMNRNEEPTAYIDENGRYAIANVCELPSRNTPARSAAQYPRSFARSDKQEACLDGNGRYYISNVREYSARGWR